MATQITHSSLVFLGKMQTLFDKQIQIIINCLNLVCLTHPLVAKARQVMVRVDLL